MIASNNAVLNDIPAGWEIDYLGNRATFRTGPFGSALHKSDYTTDGIPVVNPMHIVNGKIDPAREMSITESAARSLAEFRLKPGEIVIGRRGEMGRCAVVEDYQNGWLCGTGSMIVRPSDADAEFLQRVLSSHQVVSAIEGSSVGTTMVNLNQGTLARLRILFPPMVEQRAIAAALSDIDALLSGLDRLIAKKRDLKQAAMQQLLTGKTRLPGFEGEWVENRLDQLSTFITKGATPTTHGHEWVRDGIIFLRSECVSETGLDLEESMFISEAAHELLRRSEVRKGDLLITITGNVGRVVLLDKRVSFGNINQHIARIRVIESRSDARFLFQLLNFTPMRKYFGSIVTGQAYPQIGLQQVRDTTVVLPALAEQRAIADVLSDMDAELAALEARREKTRALKQGMMQELLTGRTRLV